MGYGRNPNSPRGRRDNAGIMQRPHVLSPTRVSIAEVSTSFLDGSLSRLKNFENVAYVGFRIVFLVEEFVKGSISTVCCLLLVDLRWWRTYSTSAFQRMLTRR